ncbi:MAG: hypothetical protein CVU56_03090 [Deltaproteobacteria bacterium HGW-Deltaproteobacteria-14]|nr:MAG: hypothetical protein CVU56_03090 [Deltaproteobacteria bacterium HGW-Deltaproteobacteria-14]
MSLRALVTAIFQLSGARLVGSAADPRWGLRELTEGRVDRLVVLSESPPVPLARRDRTRLVWYHLGRREREWPEDLLGLSWPAPLELLVKATLGRDVGPPRESWTTPGLGIVTPRLVGLLAALRPSLRVNFRVDEADAALCTVGGYARAIAFERLLDFDTLEEDPAIALLLGFHARDGRGGAPLDRDIAFVCDHSEVFSDAEPYRRYAAHVMAWIAGHPPRTVRFAAAVNERHGLDLRDVLRAALTTLSPARLDRLAGRCAHAGLDHDARVDRALTALTAPTWADPEPAQLPRTSVAPRRPSRTRPRTRQRLHAATMRGFSVETCGGESRGDPHQTLEALATARARMEARGPVVPLPGTRFVPVGMDLGDLLLFYRVGRGPLGDTFVGALRGHHGVPIPVAVRQLGRPPNGNGAAQADTAVAEIARAQSLHHPNVVGIHHIRRVAGSDLVVTELVHGVSVAELLNALEELDEPLPRPLATWIAARVALALDAAARHRDAEGRPILLADDDARPETVLVGFDGAVKLDVALALAYSLEAERATHGRVALVDDRSLAVALDERAEPGTLGGDPAAWLAGAVELVLRLVQRNEDYALNLMERCAAPMLRLRMPVKSDPLRTRG